MRKPRLRGPVTHQGHTTVEQLWNSLLLPHSWCPLDGSNPTPDSSLPQAPRRIHWHFVAQIHSPVECPHIHGAKGPELSLEISLLPGAKDATPVGPSKRPGTEQASLCPLDTATQLTFWRGSGFLGVATAIPASFFSCPPPCQSYSFPVLPRSLLTLSASTSPRPPLETTTQCCSIWDDLPGDVQMGIKTKQATYEVSDPQC